MTHQKINAVLKAIREGIVLDAFAVNSINPNSKREAIVKLQQSLKNDNYLVVLVKQ